ncbi:MAG TPA: nuclear transport factor 2 family protein [Candidatus Limnocylindrales bacterium]|jgi:ketosteroid isomerase-like protein|nr:nuclear transport factor 2 family protein [Candidatus Limnocylindrales bacterium]
MAVEVDRNRQVVERFRQAVESGDMQELARVQRELLTDDFVQEWPQSGERIRGKANVIAINENYEQSTGTSPKMALRGISGAGDHWVVEGTIDYGDGTPVSYVGIYEVKDGKLTKATEYFANPFEAPEWRRQWVERID